MGEKIPVIKEEKFAVKCYFDVKQTYSDIIAFIEDSLCYSVALKDYDEKNQDGKREITASLEANRLYNEVYKIILKFKFELEGKDETIELDGKKVDIVKGGATLTMNVFLEPDWDSQRKPGSLAKFLQEVYNKYIGNDEQDTVKKAAKKDYKLIISRFKQHMNATIK